MSDSALRALYEREIDPLLKTHAAQVEKLGAHGLYPIGVFIVAVLGLVGFAMAEWLWPALACAAVIVPTVAVLRVRVPLYQAGGSAFRALFKQRVVAHVVEIALPGAAYEPDLAVARTVIADSGIVRCGGRDLGDDLVRGTIGRTPFALGDIRSSAAGRSPGPPFRGLFFHADFSRSLAGRTVVLPHDEPLLAADRNRGLAPVPLEDPRFEALFDAHGSDPVEARYVLTPRLMERLVALRGLLGHPVYAAFDRGRVYVAIDRGEGSFDAIAYGGARAWEEIRGYAALAGAARDIVQELELNTRIWTKGFAPEAEAQAAAACEPSAWTQVAKKGAWAFQSTVPFTFDDPPAPPRRTSVERARDGRLLARYPSGWGAPLVLTLVLLGAAAARLGPLDPTSLAARFLSTHGWQAALVAAAIAATALYVARQRVRWMEAGSGGVRTGALFRRRRTLPARKIVRVFAAEDFVMAQVDGSWIPEALSPRLGSHGAALWLAAQARKALGDGA
jgi:Protein of unknown function (DUF3137)